MIAAFMIALALAGQQPRSDALPGAPAITPQPRTSATPLRMYKIILVGDSTVAPVSGWGGAFCARHVAEAVACLNLARGGRSTRSYREEGSWKAALSEAGVKGYAATYVLIQFGHNDGNPRMPVRTDLDPEFTNNLRRFIREARARGARPVLVTPLVRRLFGPEGFYNSLAPWADRMRAVATESHIPVVELNKRSAAVISSLGAAGSSALAQQTSAIPVEQSAASFKFPRLSDTTHLGDRGADMVAALVADELARAVPELSSVVAP